MSEPPRPPADRPLLVVAGASGVIGRHLVEAARGRYRVRVLTRAVDGSEPPGSEPVAWAPDAARGGAEAELERLAGALAGAAAVVNLAGASIAGGRLGEEHRRRVLRSRLDATATLLEAHRRAPEPPPLLVQASATGYYGDRGEAPLDETAAPGEGSTLADIARRWEEAAAPIEARARRVVTRFGVVLARDAEAWRRLLLPVRLFVGGPLGDGRQFLPWVHAEDAARAVLHLVETPGARGAHNVVAPQAVRQIELVRAAARRLGRPAWAPAPAPLLRLALGRFAEALLDSARVEPRRLLESGFGFRYPTLEAALDELLGPP